MNSAPGPTSQQPLFRSYWQAGFECSTHVLRTGRRLDLVNSTGHDRWLDRDYERLRGMGMETVREGLRWHLIESEDGRYDFASALAVMRAARRHGIQIIWDLLHFGWPSHLDIFAPEWLAAFADFGAEFARVLRRETHEPAYIAPVNEISFFSWAGGDTAYINPFRYGRGPELKRLLVRAFIKGTDAVRSEIPDARIVSPEPVIHIVGDPDDPGDVLEAERYRSAMFEAWDMIAGRAHPDLGGAENYLDIIGLNYYDKNQWRHHGRTIFPGEPEYRPFREIIQEVHNRYARPIFISETGMENEGRPAWLAYVANEAMSATQAGATVHGICLYPILNHPGWDDDRHCHNGLWDFPQQDGTREIYRPLAEQLLRLPQPDTLYGFPHTTNPS